jgi:glycosyltransferase involved in cell wall biosynthesis
MPAAPLPPISIIVPCFNEEDCIVECLERLAKTAPNAEILVVHGGTDKTLERAQGFAATHPNVTAVRYEDDCGKGSGIKYGLTRVKHDIILQFDADLQFEPEDMPKVIGPLAEGKADLSIGARFMPESDVSAYQFHFLRVMGNRVVNGWVSLMAGQKIYDVTTGYKAWTRRAINIIHFRRDDFAYEVEIPMRAAVEGLRIVQVPIIYHNRQAGESAHGSGAKEIYSICRCGFLILLHALLIRLRGKEKKS